MARLLTDPVALARARYREVRRQTLSTIWGMDAHTAEEREVAAQTLLHAAVDLAQARGDTAQLAKLNDLLRRRSV